MFGQPLQQNAPLFGAPTPAPTSGFSFGTPSAAQSATPAQGFSFGGVNTSNPTSGFSLGSAGTLFTSTNPVSSTAPNTTPLLGTGFGSTFTGFGTQPAVRPTFSMSQPTLGTGTNTPGLLGGLGATAPTPSAATGFGFSAPTLGTGTAFGQSSGGLGAFGTPSFGLQMAPTSTATSFGVGSFGTGLSAGTNFGTGLGFGTGMAGGVATTTQAQSFLGPSTTTTTTTTLGGVQPTPFVGLGGTGSSQTVAGGAKSDSKTIKEYPVPTEISTVAESFKKYIKDQKSIREEISRYSSKSIAKVQEEAESLRQGLSVISTSNQRYTAAIRKLKQETAQESTHVDIMQTTKEMPLSLQYENTAPTEYFQRQVVTFETNMKTFRQQIDMLELHLASGNAQQTSALTSQELLSTIRRLYETFVYLASELYIVHENLEKEKERYVTYRRTYYGDGPNIFQSRMSAPAKTSTHCSSIATTIGPSPFTNTHGSAMLASAMERAQRPTGATNPPTMGFSSNNNLFGKSGFGSSSGRFNSGSGIGASGMQSSNLLALSSSSNVMPVKPLGGGTLSAPVGGSFMPSGGFLGGTSQPAFGVANSANFQLQRPPIGNKRGKR